MLTEVRGGDYAVRLTTQEIKFLTSRRPHSLGYSDFVWPQINTDVKGSPTVEQLNIGCSVSSHILRGNDKTHDRIFFDRDDDGPIVRVHPADLYELAYGKDYMVTRYDGHSDKVWIRRDDDQPQQLDMDLPGIKSYPHVVFEMRQRYVSQSDIEHLGE